MNSPLYLTVYQQSMYAYNGVLEIDHSEVKRNLQCRAIMSWEGQ